MAGVDDVVSVCVDGVATGTGVSVSASSSSVRLIYMVAV